MLVPGFALLAIVPLGTQTTGDTRDAITLKSGVRVEGRVVRGFDAEFVYLREPGTLEPRREARVDIQVVHPVLREKIETWLDARSPDDSVARRWAHAQAADAVGMRAMARLEAYIILTLDPDFEPAHLYLGHLKKRKRWYWSLDTTGERAVAQKKIKRVTEDAFHAEVAEDPGGLALESENYRLETNVPIGTAVPLLYDLERTYCTWMGIYGEVLEAAELPWNPVNRMVVRVYRGPEDGFRENFDTARTPYYSASDEVRIAGSPNVVLTYFDHPSAERPLQFFDLATQQLMFTTLGLGHRRSGPPAREVDHWAHWLELGVGALMERGFSGTPGYVRYAPTPPGTLRTISRETAMSALTRTGSNGGKELANLVSMAWVRFYGLGGDGAIRREKARSLVAYLLTQAPPIMDRRGNLASGTPVAALYCYMKSVFQDPKAHSSRALDDCLGGRVEGLEEGWREWLMAVAR